MRKDSIGLFWEELDGKYERQLKVLGEKGWSEVLPGYWCQDFYIQDDDVDEFSCALKMDEAYSIAKATSEKCEPPDPIWLLPDYLPGLDEARAFPVTLYTDAQLYEDGMRWRYGGRPKHRLIFDIECYPNYFLIAFSSAEHGKVIYFEMTFEIQLWIDKMRWVLENFCVIGFNSISYDLIIAALALAGKSNAQLKTATKDLIEFQERGYVVLRRHKVKKLQIDHIDLIEVAPLFASLKIYGGRLHCEKMQDLPFVPDTVLSDDQIAIVRYYCINDLANTQIVYSNLTEEIKLREDMSEQYGVELRSKSDAQIAEAVIVEEVGSRNRCRLQRPQIDPGTTYYYNIPSFIKYQSPLMQWVLKQVGTAPFVVTEKGSIGLPEVLKGLKIEMGYSTYKMGIGGLHSTEKKTAHMGGPNNTLEDVDVESYYPKIILNQGLFPQHLGTNFLVVYLSIVTRRLKAKASGDKSTSDSLKIVINGSFGKFGSKYSVLYAPDLLIQVTITGQLALLMLIERLEIAGIPVVSANTDGIVINCPNTLMPLRNQILDQWQKETDFKLDGNVYSALYSRDVNNYIAVKKNPKNKDDKFKVKGAYSRPGFHKNPTNEICIMALEAYLGDGVPVAETVRGCTDIKKFVSVRTVKGGAAKVHEIHKAPAHDTKEELIRRAGYLPYYNETWKLDNQEGMSALTLDEAYGSAKAKYEKPATVEFLGKAVRWYYGANVHGPIVYALSGKKVPRSDGAVPMLQMPTTFPSNIDHQWYINETNKILSQIGC